MKRWEHLLSPNRVYLQLERTYAYGIARAHPSVDFLPEGKLVGPTKAMTVVPSETGASVFATCRVLAGGDQVGHYDFRLQHHAAV
jgi:hypothetical protein